MILQPAQKSDFDFSGRILVDVDNAGFSEKEIKKIDYDYQEDPHAKGFEWINKFWKKNRPVPPEIQNLKSEFGYQANPFLINLADVAKEEGTPLEGQIKVLSNNYNFFVMPCGVFISPEDGEKFEALKFEVQYKNDNVSTYSMFPGAKQKDIFKVGVQINLGITGKAEFGLPKIPSLTTSYDANAKVDVEAKFIVSFDYEFKTQEIDAFGMNNRFSRWVMYKGKDLRNDVTFYPIVRAAKSVNKFECVFKAYFKISNQNWQRAELFEKEPKKINVRA